MSAGVRISSILDILISDAQLLGIFERVNQYESTTSPGSGLTAEIVWIMGPTPMAGRSGLASTSARVVYGMRIMLEFKNTPKESLDPAITNAVDLYVNSLLGELALADAQGSFIDVFGMGGVPIDAVGGYLTLDQTTYRIGTITIPVIMENVWTQVN